MNRPTPASRAIHEEPKKLPVRSIHRNSFCTTRLALFLPAFPLCTLCSYAKTPPAGGDWRASQNYPTVKDRRQPALAPPSIPKMRTWTVLLHQSSAIVAASLVSDAPAGGCEERRKALRSAELGRAFRRIARTVFHRSRALIALLSIALLAGDNVVALVGHDHAERATPAASRASNRDHACHRHGHSHTHCHANGGHPHGDSSEPNTPSGHSHEVPCDECAICRHFSQPVAPVAAAIELGGGQRVELLASRHVPQAGAPVRIRQDARGPPMSRA
jgi:hypothetical protein